MSSPGISTVVCIFLLCRILNSCSVLEWLSDYYALLIMLRRRYPDQMVQYLGLKFGI